MKTTSVPGVSRMRSLTLAFAVLMSVAAPVAWAQPSVTAPQNLVEGPRETSEGGTILNGVGFDQRLNAQLPLDLRFRDENDQDVLLGNYFNQGRPVVLNLVYFRCPMLCNQVLNGLVRSLRPLSLDVGKDFDIITVSIDPEETPFLASRKKLAYLEEYNRDGAEDGWHFLTGDEDQIRRLAETVGFRYTYSPTTKLYAHTAGLVVLTSGGQVSRYLFGIDYPPRDLQFSLMESSSGRIGSPVRHILMFCYDYDAAAGKYTLSIVRALQVLGVATVGIVSLTVLMMVRWERRHRRDQAPGPDPIGRDPA